MLCWRCGMGVVLEVRVVEGCVGGEGCGGLCWR